ncbi:hypothetical protein BHF71_01900 [Vulcanibacillus modesticaldus]|uniref:4Fe-4S ferredoxin-type domain-containing protein n=1 Tax=Vulcanibacillus modesticaldus TaxID=337097 RepID=A0A1D2YUQ2_9BACI|nr:4Fe-4S binding protein [Vulcanibacillus modesticaldus]OEF99366.1 hypothetical protein BHF71_01900 [Vulcanibacillus modesticaldus]
MAFKVNVDQLSCFSCGICMDVCPQKTIDMTRPKEQGPWGEFNRDQAKPYEWMMEFPIQVSKCVNCKICVNECPVQAITILEVEEIEFEKPGIMLEEPSDETGWQPLSNYTKAAFKHGPKRDPWPKKEFSWKTLVMAKRKNRFKLS